MSKEIDVRELDFLLRFNIDHSYSSPVDFLSNSAWSAIKVRPTYSPPPRRSLVPSPFTLCFHPGHEFHR